MPVSLLRSDDICASRKLFCCECVCVCVHESKPGVCLWVLRMCLCDAVVSYYCASVSLQRHQSLASVIETTLNKQTGRQT